MTNFLNSIYSWYGDTVGPVVGFWAMLAAIVVIIGLIVWLCVSNAHKRKKIRMFSRIDSLTAAASKTQTDQTESEIDDANKKIDELTKKVNDAESNSSKLTAERDNYKSALDSADKTISELHDEIHKLESENDSLKTNVGVLTAGIEKDTDVDNFKRDLDAELTKLQSILDTFKVAYHDDVYKYNRETLFGYAKELGIKNYSKLSNQELSDAIADIYEKTVSK